jgi:hypothetical protein
MPAPLSGPGIGLAFPQNLYPSELSNAPYDASSNRQCLAPGESIVLPAGDWYVTMGFYCVIQHLDPVTNTWVLGQGGSYERGMAFVKSDGFNARVANLTGCPVGGTVVQYGSGWVQSSTTITVTGGGGSTWLPIVGGQLTTSPSTIVTANAGAGYGVAPLVFIPPPPPASNNANGVGGVQAHGFASITNGTISSFSFTNPGAGYPTIPKAVVVPSPFDPNLSTGITAGTITFSIVGSGSICAILCTNSGAPIANPANITLGLSGVGSQATIAPFMMQTTTTVSLAGTGTGWGTLGALITTVGGNPSTGTITTSPEFNHTYWIPRPLQALGANTVGLGTIAAQTATIIDGGLFLGTPTAIQSAGSQAGTPVGNTITLTMGSTPDWVQIQAAP